MGARPHDEVSLQKVAAAVIAIVYDTVDVIPVKSAPAFVDVVAVTIIDGVVAFLLLPSLLLM